MKLWGFVVFCLIVPLTASAQTLTAINMDPDWQGINGWAWYIGNSTNGATNSAACQEFVTTESGLLSILEASVDRFSGGEPLVITFHEADANRPGATLGSVSVSPDDVRSWAGEIPTPINTFDVSAANVMVEAGQNYFVTFTTPVGGAIRYRAILTAPNNNSFGYRALYSQDAGVSWVFPNISPEIGMRLYVGPAGPVEYEVGVDVLSDSRRNRIRLGRRKPKPLRVNVFGNSDVSGNDILLSSIGLGDSTIAGGIDTAPKSGEVLDLNGDRIPDLQLVFDLGTLEDNGSIDADSTVLELSGMLTSGDLIYGSDSITVH